MGKVTVFDKVKNQKLESSNECEQCKQNFDFKIIKMSHLPSRCSLSRSVTRWTVSLRHSTQMVSLNLSLSLFKMLKKLNPLSTFLLTFNVISDQSLVYTTLGKHTYRNDLQLHSLVARYLFNWCVWITFHMELPPFSSFSHRPFKSKSYLKADILVGAKDVCVAAAWNMNMKFIRS